MNHRSTGRLSGVGRVIGRVLAGNDLRQGGQGHHERRPRLRVMVCGAAMRGCGQNCARRDEFIKKLAPSGPGGRIFEGPDGAKFAWIGASRFAGRVTAVGKKSSYLCVAIQQYAS